MLSSLQKRYMERCKVATIFWYFPLSKCRRVWKKASMWSKKISKEMRLSSSEQICLARPKQRTEDNMEWCHTNRRKRTNRARTRAETCRVRLMVVVPLYTGNQVHQLNVLVWTFHQTGLDYLQYYLLTNNNLKDTAPYFEAQAEVRP